MAHNVNYDFIFHSSRQSNNFETEVDYYSIAEFINLPFDPHIDNSTKMYLYENTGNLEYFSFSVTKLG